MESTELSEITLRAALICFYARGAVLGASASAGRVGGEELGVAATAVGPRFSGNGDVAQEPGQPGKRLAIGHKVEALRFPFGAHYLADVSVSVCFISWPRGPRTTGSGST
jgi:hypothetical protein